jgi:hypothetical protein
MITAAAQAGIDAALQRGLELTARQSGLAPGEVQQIFRERGGMTADNEEKARVLLGMRERLGLPDLADGSAEPTPQERRLYSDFIKLRHEFGCGR